MNASRQVCPLFCEEHTLNRIPAGYLTILTTGVAANGTSNNTFSYVDTKGNTYVRDVDAAYDVITYDEQSGSLATTPLPTLPLFSNAKSIPGVRLPGGQSVSNS
jgi:hypothetical protein